jgi:hypothetical protein
LTWLLAVVMFGRSYGIAADLARFAEQISQRGVRDLVVDGWVSSAAAGD